MNTIRTYMNFSKAIDPAQIITMADLELSVALASPLVTFDKERQITSALANKWQNINKNKIKFTLRPNLKWSDGSPISALHFKEALDRAKKDHASDLRALFDSVASIDVDGNDSLVFTTVEEVSKSGILLKLTEPMYGLVFINNGKLDLSKSAGSFVVDNHDDHHILLSANKNWYEYSDQMPSKVEIRRIPKDIDVITNFKKDEWSNLISGTSLMKAVVKDAMTANGFTTWQRSLDKVFSLYPSKKFLDQGGANFLKELSLKINKSNLLDNFTGYALADQFFPRGYELWSAEPPIIKLQENFSHNRTIRIVIPDNQYAIAFKGNLEKTLALLTKTKIDCKLFPINELNNQLKSGDYDLLAGGVAVADPNFEGAMSFFIERDPPFIPSGPAPNDFSQQMKLTRSLATSKERASSMRKIIIRAQEAGYVLPLFHFSSLAIAKPGIDLSEVPNSDETVLFSKVRIR
ncbi:MAG: ABC transporter substrate-binding protein [Pseudomonadota bacterium]|nr:ABC transporter substrate-binding protein [Pseudomonadota bacterium]